MAEVKTYVVENVLPEARKAAAEAIEKKAKEEQVKRLAELDQSLTIVKKTDPETGIESSYTWKDFDSDKDGSLNPPELIKASTLISTYLMKKVASGEISKDEALRTGKAAGTSIGALGLIFAGLAVAKRLKPAPKNPPAPAEGGKI
jgi:hypothetical protein